MNDFAALPLIRKEVSLYSDHGRHNCLVSSTQDGVSFDPLFEKACKTKGTAGWFEASLYPVRTSSPGDFCVDFICPVTAQAIRTDLIVTTILSMIFTIPWDILTFPCRVITVIPRVIFSLLEEPHPLYEEYDLEHLFVTYIEERDATEGDKKKTITKTEKWSIYLIRTPHETTGEPGGFPREGNAVLTTRAQDGSFSSDIGSMTTSLIKV